MTADEAKQALKEGKKVRGTYWRKSLYLIQNGEYILTSDGEISSFKVLELENEWEIVE